jgi:hypothetical protein
MTRDAIHSFTQGLAAASASCLSIDTKYDMEIVDAITSAIQVESSFQTMDGCKMASEDGQY